MIKKISVIFLILFLSNACFGADIIVDDSVHSQIAKKYNLENLPDLPANVEDTENIFTPNEFDTEPTTKSSAPVTQTQPKPEEKQQTVQSQPTTQKPVTTVPNTVSRQQNTVVTTPQYTGNFEKIKLNRWMKFSVVNSKQISDSMKKGTKITFISTMTETSRYITIPTNTVFIGVIEDSHTPQLTGNGGLLVIRVNKIKYNGKYYPINAKITVANDKNIFFNNIKGKRQYWKNMAKKTKWGKKTYDRMWAKTKKYFKPSIEIIITPITFLTGTVAYGANIISSPVLAIFTKGGRLTIPQNSRFEIKLLEDAVIGQ